MTEAEHRHTPARETTTSEVPAEVARYLDGTDLLAKTQALRLSTIANTPFEITVYKVGDKYVAARSNEFGYANYEVE